MAKNTGSVLADHYKAIGREEKAAAIRTWLNAVKAELEKGRTDLLRAKWYDGMATEVAELRGGIAIIKVLLDRMNEASDAAPAEGNAHPGMDGACAHGVQYADHCDACAAGQ